MMIDVIIVVAVAVAVAAAAAAVVIVTMIIGSGENCFWMIVIATIFRGRYGSSIIIIFQ
jgi:hypothetical protein